MLVFKIVIAVRDVEGLSSSQKSILFVLATSENNEQGTKKIYPGLDYLARKAGVSVRTARTAVMKLTNDGWIKEEPGRENHVKGYSICLEKLGIPPGTIKPLKKKGVQPPAEEPRDYEHGYAAQSPAAPPDPEGELTEEEKSVARRRRRAEISRRSLESFQRMGLL